MEKKQENGERTIKCMNPELKSENLNHLKQEFKTVKTDTVCVSECVHPFVEL